VTRREENEEMAGVLIHESPTASSTTPVGRNAVAGILAITAMGLILSACGGGPATPSTSRSTSTKVGSTLTRAVGEMKSGNDALAVADFLAVVKADRKNYVAWYDLGVIAQRDHQANVAANDYLSSLGGNRNYVPALYNLAILETAKQPQAAATLYKDAITAEPNNANAHLNYGFVLEALGQQLAGEEQIAYAIKLDPSLNSRVPSGTLPGG
jgi:Tfp pilus assembly protein PilF